jgi:hypothetical protein
MISQYEKLSQEHAELSKMHAALMETKQPWGGERGQDASTGIGNHMRGSTVAISSVNGDTSSGGDGGFPENGLMVFLMK